MSFSVDQWIAIAGVVVAASTSLLVVILGFYINHLSKKFEHIQWRNQKLIEKRLTVYDDLAKLLNDNLCYFTYVGNWKDRTPKDVVQSKREIDRIIYLAAPLFSKKFFQTCIDYQELCFETYNGTGRDALLKTTFLKREEFCANWRPEWSDCFSTKITSPYEIEIAYRMVMQSFADEIGLDSESFYARPN